jgi:4a-hydroxytetrahydrobiopterin dehydratase
MPQLAKHPEPVNFADYADTIPSWSLCSGGREIERTYIFKDFKKAFAFMTLSAAFAEQLDHHPDWTNSWNTVVVRLSTHSAKGLTELDITMAKAMDQFALELNSAS